MIAALALTALVAVAAADGDAETTSTSTAPAVVLLPLRPEGSVTRKQAEGVSVRLRAIVADKAFVNLLSASPEDKRHIDKCGDVVACYAELADIRGADVVAVGVVRGEETSLQVILRAVTPVRGAVHKEERVTLNGKDDAQRLERMARMLLAPDTLRGSLMVTGPVGAHVTLDGRAIGELPFARPITQLREGDHELLVEQEGFTPFKRRVAIVDQQTTTTEASLLPASALAQRPGDEGPGINPLVLGFGIAGAALVVGGGVFGALSFRDGMEVDARAKAQQLLFPRDKELVDRGNAFAWTANGLYAGGILCLGAAAIVTFVAPDET